MTNSSDAAEQLVRAYIELYLEGTKVALNITGKAAKNVASALYVIAKDSNKTKGKTRLNTMLKTGKELKIFPVRREDLKKFSSEAKRYGVLYCALLDKGIKSPDGMVDIMVKSEDASKIDRIVRRFNIQTLSSAEIKSEIAKAKEENSQNVINKGVQTKDKEVVQKEEEQKVPIQKDKNETSPSIAKTEKKPLLENSLESKEKLEGIVTKDKPSVRQELKEIKEDLENKAKLKSNEKSKEKEPSKNNKKRSKKKERVK